MNLSCLRLRPIMGLMLIILSSFFLHSCAKTDVSTQPPAVNNEYTIPRGTLSCLIGNTRFAIPARILDTENSVDSGITAFRKGNDILIVANGLFTNNRVERMQFLIKNVNTGLINRLDSISIVEPGNLKGGQTYGLFSNAAMVMTTDAPDVGGNSITVIGTVGLSEIVNNNQISGRFSFLQTFNGRAQNITQGAFFRIPLR